MRKPRLKGVRFGKGKILHDQAHKGPGVPAVRHDIGSSKAEGRCDRAAGTRQEEIGLGAAGTWREFVLEPGDAEQISCLAGRHHTYETIQGLEYPILAETDFLADMAEEARERDAIETAKEKIFKTKPGKDLLNAPYGV